jgi:Holliday junction resolvase
MPSPQKQKGSGYERDVARFLTELYGETFIRAPGSGAYVGGKNQERKEFLHEGQIRSFKGDIVPGESFVKLNVECKFYKDFPFHLTLTGECKQLDSWLEQLLDVEDEGDLNILFMKFNRIGQYIAVQPKLTWKMLNYTFYASKKYGDWLITEKDSFFKDNKDLFKFYSSDTTSKTIT